MSKVKLGDIVRRIKDLVDKDNTDLIYYIGGEHFDKRSLTVTRKGIIKGSTIGPAFSTKFKAGDVLLMSRNPHLRKAGIVNFDGICSDVSYIIRTRDENVIMQKFIPILFQSDIFWEFAEKNKKGSTNFFLNWSDFERFEFDLPDIETQQKLCDELWAINDTIDSYKEMIKQSNELIKAKFIEMFGIPIINDKGWFCDKAINLCHIVTDGAHFSPKEDKNGKIPMLSVKDMSTSGFSYEKCKMISEEDYSIMKRQGCIPQEGDVLVAKDGSYFTRAFTIHEFKKQAILSSIGLYRPNQSKLIPEFLTDYLMSNEVIEFVNNGFVTGSALKRVIIKGLKEIPVYVPPLDLQNDYVEFAKGVEEAKLKLQKSYIYLEIIYKKILTKYLTKGEN